MYIHMLVFTMCRDVYTHGGVYNVSPCIYTWWCLQCVAMYIHMVVHTLCRDVYAHAGVNSVVYTIFIIHSDIRYWNTKVS